MEKWSNKYWTFLWEEILIRHCWSLFWPFSYSHMQFPWNFPPSTPLIFLNFPPSINPLLHALKTELFFPPKICSSLFVHFQKYLRTPKQYSSIQQRILAWTNSSRRARRHVWCWMEFHPHHCQRGDIMFSEWSALNCLYFKYLAGCRFLWIIYTSTLARLLSAVLWEP